MSQIMISQDKRVCDLLPLSVVKVTHLATKPSTNTKDWTCLHPLYIEEFVQVLARQRIGRALLPYSVVYGSGVHPGATDDKMISVGLELYGYLATASLGLFGNWNMRGKDIHRATWNLRLEGGLLDDIFCQQADALWEIEQYIVGTIQGQGLPVRDIEQGRARLRAGIFVNRRVFCKVRDGKPEKNLAKVGPAAKYHNQWRIPDTPQLGQRRQDGTIAPCRPERIRRGDFVKVSVQFAVERKIYPRLGNVTLRLHLNQVIQLVPAWETGEGKDVQVIPALFIEGDDVEDSQAEIMVEEPGFQEIF
ncbi:hypothetical protein K488DRAFT_70179 [Vararia minispora EC-137]|uniref:Uncharacterized protein n=1 Tax=Vararia minispora EC-137 TaxID=1314806 RepID=A0ACB8QMJ1_9AGAM|nr:hypothetical protein K488DRAFT_70179 [Vararia minispora EC-137]